MGLYSYNTDDHGVRSIFYTTNDKKKTFKLADEFHVERVVDEIDNNNEPHLLIKYYKGKSEKTFVAPYKEMVDARGRDHLTSKGIAIKGEYDLLIAYITMQYEQIRNDASKRSIMYKKLGFFDFYDDHDQTIKKLFLLDKAYPTHYGLHAVDGVNEYWTSRGNIEAYFDMLHKEVYGNAALEATLLLAPAAPIWTALNNATGTTGFCVNLSAPNSFGKSTASELAASFAGRPRRGNKSGVIKTFNATLTAAPVQLQGDGALLVCDDRNASDLKDEEIRSLIYSVACGVSRQRCLPDESLAPVINFSSVYLFSVEQSLLNGNGGDAARIFEFTVPQFTHSKQNSNRIRRCIDKHYGLLMPIYIEFIMQGLEKNREYLENLIEEKTELLCSYLDPKNATGGRIASALAYILVANKLFNDCFKQYTPGIDEERILNFLLDNLYKRDPKIVKSDATNGLLEFLQNNYEFNNGIITSNHLANTVGTYTGTEVLLERDWFTESLKLEFGDWKKAEQYLENLIDSMVFQITDKKRPTCKRFMYDMDKHRLFDEQMPCFVVKHYGEFKPQSGRLNPL